MSRDGCLPRRAPAGSRNRGRAGTWTRHPGTAAGPQAAASLPRHRPLRPVRGPRSCPAGRLLRIHAPFQDLLPEGPEPRRPLRTRSHDTVCHGAAPLRLVATRAIPAPGTSCFPSSVRAAQLLAEGSRPLSASPGCGGRHLKATEPHPSPAFQAPPAGDGAGVRNYPFQAGVMVRQGERHPRRRHPTLSAGSGRGRSAPSSVHAGRQWRRLRHSGARHPHGALFGRKSKRASVYEGPAEAPPEAAQGCTRQCGPDPATAGGSALPRGSPRDGPLCSAAHAPPGLTAWSIRTVTASPRAGAREAPLPCARWAPRADGAEQETLGKNFLCPGREKGSSRKNRTQSADRLHRSALGSRHSALGAQRSALGSLLSARRAGARSPLDHVTLLSVG